jgi:hypothetical protein
LIVYARKKLKQLIKLVELSLIGVTGVSADFTLINIATNQVFSNLFTLIHTIHSSYTTESKFNYLDDKFYYDFNIDWIFDSKHICQNHSAVTNFRAINETIKSNSREDAVISGVEDIIINV